MGFELRHQLKGCHAVPKAYLRVSTGDLKGVFDRLLPFWLTRHRGICDASAQEQNRITHQLNKRYFDSIQGLVYDRALYLILKERAKLHKAQAEARAELEPCNCTIKASIGLPCFHTVFERVGDGLGQILLEDIHPFWWYNRSKASTPLVLLLQMQNRATISLGVWKLSSLSML